MRREDPVKMEIKDPDNKDYSNIEEIIKINNNQYLFKLHSAYSILLAEITDPGNSSPQKKHSYEKILNSGTNSIAFQRILFPFYDIISKIVTNKDEKNSCLDSLWNVFILFEKAEKIYFDLQKEIINKINISKVLMTNNNCYNTTPSLPQIENLKDKIFDFFRNIKLAYIKMFNILYKFNYIETFTHRSEAYFNKHLEHLENNFNENFIFKFLNNNDNKGAIYAALESRNACEHERDGQRLNLKNIHLDIHDNLQRPKIQYDLQEKLEFYSDDIDLEESLCTVLEKYLSIFENVFAVVLNDKYKTDITYIVKNEDYTGILTDFTKTFWVEHNFSSI